MCKISVVFKSDWYSHRLWYTFADVNAVLCITALLGFDSVWYCFCFRLGGNVWCFYCGSKLPIMLFVGQYFSGSLFYAITLLLCVRETTQGERGRRSKGAFPSPLRISPKSVIPLERREEREHCFCNAQSRIPLSWLLISSAIMGCWI